MLLLGLAAPAHDASDLALLSPLGLEATYVLGNVGKHDEPKAATTPGTATGRLAELKQMLDSGLVTQAEYDAQRRAVIDSV